MRIVKPLAVITGIVLLTDFIDMKVRAPKIKESFNELSATIEQKTAASFNEGVKFGRMLQKHDNRAQ